jgi:hypothetical protein
MYIITVTAINDGHGIPLLLIHAAYDPQNAATSGR